ncbi:MAG: hypothetical protein ACXVXI_05440 [Mycobacteriaceae bacterium]
MLPGCWGRHPQLAALAERVEGVVSPGEHEPDGEPYIDLDLLAQALNDFDVTNDASAAISAGEAPSSTLRLRSYAASPV